MNIRTRPSLALPPHLASSALFGSHSEEALQVRLYLAAGTFRAARLACCVFVDGGGHGEFLPAFFAFVGVGWHRRYSAPWIHRAEASTAGRPNLRMKFDSMIELQ